MGWQYIESPGQFGKQCDARYEGYDARFGKNQWRIVWIWGKNKLEFKRACKHYERSYWNDSFKRPEIWRELITTASEVYDYSHDDIKSGCDYLIQAGPATHIQDIAIRNVVRRHQWNFKGSEPVQVRGLKSRWGELLSPGKVMFHKPNNIVTPHLHGWWELNSVEDFWQSNKIVQARELELVLGLKT
ncbi:hypothetical protein HYZ97_03235 [Candidatus Pacearchaeota archaeon]|nr:hypothetical protein [Candidatus Pacearchaeota archaeon]